MLLGIVNGILIFYLWTWFIWPFVFVFGLAFGIADLVKNENSKGKGLIWAGIALLIMTTAMIGYMLR